MPSKWVLSPSAKKQVGRKGALTDSYLSEKRLKNVLLDSLF